VAHQRGSERVLVAGERRARVTLASRARIGRRKLRPGDYLCAGETLAQLGVNGALVARTTRPNGGMTPADQSDPVVNPFSARGLVFPGQLVVARGVVLPGAFADRIQIAGRSVDALSLADVGRPVSPESPFPLTQLVGGDLRDGHFEGFLEADGNLALTRPTAGRSVLRQRAPPSHRSGRRNVRLRGRRPGDPRRPDRRHQGGRRARRPARLLHAQRGARPRRLAGRSPVAARGR